jgi:hypothetical protein
MSAIESLNASIDIATKFPGRKVYSEDFGYTYVYLITLTEDHIICLYLYSDSPREHLMVAFEGRIIDNVLHITHGASENSDGNCSFVDAIKSDNYPIQCAEIILNVKCQYNDTIDTTVQDWDTFHDNFINLVSQTEETKHKHLYYITQLRGENLLIP